MSRRRISGAVLAAVGGAAAPFAFSPFDAHGLIVLSLAALFVSFMTAPSPRQAAVNGLIFGLFMFGIGVSWVYVSLHRYGEMSAPLAVALVAVFVGFLALFPAAVGFLSRRFLAQSLVPQILGLPSLWILGEWIRGWLFTGFPWLSVGYSQVQGPLSPIAPLGGVYAVGWFVALVAAVLAGLSVVRGRRPLLLSFATLVALGLALGVAAHARWVQPSGHPLRVALVQGDIPEDVKWVPGALDRIVDHYLSLTRQAPRAAIIVWPETAIPTYLSVLRPAVIPRLQRFARLRHTTLFVGLVEDRTGRIYNSIARIGDGPIRFYRKQHLVPFGEYLPWPAALGPLLNYLRIPMSDFNRWHRPQPPVTADHQRLGISICYEDAFGSQIIRSLPAASVLVNVSDDGWFGRSFARYQHLEIARMRALEAGRYMLSDTNNGITAVIDERGRVLQQLPSFESAVLVTTIRPFAGATPYVRYGDRPAILVASILLAALVGLRWWQGRARLKRGMRGRM